MLSGETASGRYPVESARLMARIAEEAERESDLQASSPPVHAEHTGAEDVIGMAAELLARELGAVCIVAFTMSGDTARFVSMSRPACPILGLSPDERARRRMTLYKGVLPRAIAGSFERAALLARRARRTALDIGLGAEGDLIVLVYGEPVGSGVRANTVRLARIGAMGTLDSPGTMIVHRGTPRGAD